MASFQPILVHWMGKGSIQVLFHWNTGGWSCCPTSGRLQQGLDLLASELAEKLFVSGVHCGVDVQELLNISRATVLRSSVFSPRLCCSRSVSKEERATTQLIFPSRTPCVSYAPHQMGLRFWSAISN